MNAELTRALAFQRYRNLATLERARERPMEKRNARYDYREHVIVVREDISPPCVWIYQRGKTSLLHETTSLDEAMRWIDRKAETVI